MATRSNQRDPDEPARIRVKVDGGNRVCGRGVVDGGAYEIHDAMAMISGKLGTGAWTRSAE